MADDIEIETPAPIRRRRGRKALAMVAVIAVSAAGGATIGTLTSTTTTVAAVQPATTQPATTTQQPARRSLDPFNVDPASNTTTTTPTTTTPSTTTIDAAAIAQKVDAGLVDITIKTADGEAAGTGMVLTSTGEILTNNHVITGATSISVRDVGNGLTYTATVVGYDRTADVAVIQLANASGLSTVKTDTAAAAIGEAVVGIGNAGGTGGTPSYAAGLVTATGQSITASDEGDGTSEQLTNLIETDASIQAGDSGGSLVDAAGEVVGMDTAGSTSSGFRDASTAASGYAIPIATALQVAKAIEAGQSSSTVHIGSTGALGVYVTSEQAYADGATVEQVVAGGAAATAGLTAGDVITDVNGSTIATADDLSTALGGLAPGKSVSVTYTDTAGASHTVTVTLGTGAPQ